MIAPADLRAVHPKDLSIFDLTYDLPQERIAQRPLEDRDASRLLVHRKGEIRDHLFRELPDLIPAGSLLLLNNTRVVKARILFQRGTGARIEVFCLEPADGAPLEKAFEATGTCAWQVMLGNARKWKAGEKLVLRSADLELTADRIAQHQVRFSWKPCELSFAEVLDRAGHVPLPPYMTRPDDAADQERYNTVFARHDGSVAAPTASLHFTPRILKKLQEREVSLAEVTLHVGAGTFQPVKADRMADHEMHREQVRIPIETVEALWDQLRSKKPIVPVGTTALRTIESIYWHGLKLLRGEPIEIMDVDQWEPYEHSDPPSPERVLEVVLDRMRTAGNEHLIGSTRLLIAPGYRFRFADGLITNFHQPQSTLLLLVAALIGNDWRKVYDHALAHGYRFLSYGDGSLLWKGMDHNGA